MLQLADKQAHYWANGETRYTEKKTKTDGDNTRGKSETDTQRNRGRQTDTDKQAGKNCMFFGNTKLWYWTAVTLPEDLKGHFGFISTLACIQDSGEGELIRLQAPPHHVLNQAHCLAKLHQQYTCH